MSTINDFQESTEVNGGAVTTSELVDLLQIIASVNKPIEFSQQRGEDKRWYSCANTYNELNLKPKTDLVVWLKRVYE